MGELSIWHWLIVIGAILLLFGPKKLPELMRGMGEGIHEFKKAMREGDEAVKPPADPGKVETPRLEPPKN